MKMYPTWGNDVSIIIKKTYGIDTISSLRYIWAYGGLAAVNSCPEHHRACTRQAPKHKNNYTNEELPLILYIQATRVHSLC